MVRNGLWIGAVLFAASTAGADVSAIVKDCEGCHGPGGVSTEGSIPTIAGISSGVHGDYLLTFKEKGRPCEKTEYKHGDTKRPATDMCAVAGKLSDEEINAVAAHFADQKFSPAKQTVDAAKAAAGAKLHARDCEKCHTGKGADATADAGLLAGQWLPYLQESFKEFASGDRPQPKKMKEKLDKLSPADLEALAHYYASLQ
jgi:sulfide dehydrogenase cytochrome subunit